MRSLHIVFHSSCTIPTNSIQGFRFLHIFANTWLLLLLLLLFLYNSHPNRCKMMSLWFWFAFPWWLMMPSIVFYSYWPFVCLSEKCQSKFLAHFLNHVISQFCLFVCLFDCVCYWDVEFLYIFWKITSHQIYSLLLQDTKIYRNRLHFYTPIINYLKRKLEKLSHL